jgi:plastocyanin
MSMRRTPIAIVLLLASLALVAAGCGGDDDDDTTSATTTTETGATGATGEGGDTGGATTEISMTEYSFDPSDPTVASGDSLDVVNDGEIVHNLTVEDTDLATSDLDGGASEDLTVDLDPGDYEFICTIAGHAEQGMTGTLTVEE